jgi:hypothetical protein
MMVIIGLVCAVRDCVLQIHKFQNHSPQFRKQRLATHPQITFRKLLTLAFSCCWIQIREERELDCGLSEKKEERGLAVRGSACNAAAAGLQAPGCPPAGRCQPPRMERLPLARRTAPARTHQRPHGDGAGCSPLGSSAAAGVDLGMGGGGGLWEKNGSGERAERQPQDIGPQRGEFDGCYGSLGCMWEGACYSVGCPPPHKYT